MFELKPIGLWGIPESEDFLWEQISNLAPDGTQGAMLMMNFIAHQYQSGNLEAPDPNYGAKNNDDS